MLSPVARLALWAYGEQHLRVGHLGRTQAGTAGLWQQGARDWDRSMICSPHTPMISTGSVGRGVQGVDHGFAPDPGPMLSPLWNPRISMETSQDSYGQGIGPDGWDGALDRWGGSSIWEWNRQTGPRSGSWGSVSVGWGPGQSCNILPARPFLRNWRSWQGHVGSGL